MKIKEHAKNYDWLEIILPILITIILSGLIFIYPTSSKNFLTSIRFFLGNDFGGYYVLMALIFFGSSLYTAFSRLGKIKLGNLEKPKYSTFKWGTMIFTSTMSADVIFYSLSEWTMYSNEPFIKNRAGGISEWSLTYSLFHWGPLAWGFYIMLAAAFGYMLYVKKNNKQKFSEACRPLLGSRIDHGWGKVIDLIAIFALIAGTATTFSISMPLLSAAISKILNIPNSRLLAIGMLIFVATAYTIVVSIGMKGISKMATFCIGLFVLLLSYFFFLGGQERFIVENGISSVGNLIQNFVGMSTWLDPTRQNNFPQNWTIYYWSYWMVWCVATPFFIGSISEGRTLKNMILGGYAFGLSGTYVSFIVLENYGLAQQIFHKVNILQFISHGGNYADAIIKVVDTTPFPTIGLLLIVITMTGLYTTVFDSITMVISTYSYKQLAIDQEPSHGIRIFWSFIFILLPMTLLFSKSSVYCLQSVSIISAFPIGIIMLIILISFFKETKKYK